MEKTYSCPQCGTNYLITDELFDISLQCSQCQNIFTVSKEQDSEKENQTVDILPTSTLQKIKIFCGKHKKSAFCIFALVFIGIFFLWLLPLIIHKNITKAPEILQQYATVFGTPLQRATACRILGFTIYLQNRETNREQLNYYYDKAYDILDKCEETAPILEQKIYFKHKGDISGWISSDGKRLIKLDKIYIWNYVIAKYRLNRQTADDHLLLKEYEQHLLTQIDKKGMHPGLTGALGNFYLNDNFPDFPHDWKKAEYYLEKTVEDKRFFSYIINLLQCCALQGKYDKMETTAEKYINSSLKGNFIYAVAKTVFAVYTANLRYQNSFVKSEKNYEKALKWKNIALKHQPGQKRFLDDMIKNSFPEKY